MSTYVCMYVCVYIICYIYVHTHTRTHTIRVIRMYVCIEDKIDREPVLLARELEVLAVKREGERERERERETI